MSEAKGTVYDLGYKRYVGSRRAERTRWRVIMRNQISMGWKTWWRYKAALAQAVVTTFIAGGFLYLMTNEIVRSVGASGGAAGNMVLTMGDAVVPLSISHFCRAAFVLSLTLGASVIATDTQSGAFTFYFVRSIRPRDYVLGKLAGYGVLVGSLIVVPTMLLAGLRLGFSGTSIELAQLMILPKVLLISSIATVVYTAIPLAMSSLVNNRRYALAMWAAYYLAGGLIAGEIGKASGSAIAVLDIQSALQAITYNLFDLRILRGDSNDLSLTTAVIGLLVQSGVAIAITWYQVSRDHKTGVGGSS
jgi:ABC-type transport system involved in multi-copper enzyme maturation permease subunit